jgi:hypothetical protein
MLLTRFVLFASLSTHKPRQSAARTSIAGQAYVRWTLRAIKNKYFKRNIYWNGFIVELKFKELEMEDKIQKIKVFFEEKYDPEILFLYGSFATETYNKVSDIDCICFANINSFIHDSSMIDGNVLDGWIYPLKEIQNTDLMLHIIPCEVLIDKNNISKEIINKIIKKRSENTVQMNFDEKKQLIGWIKKMIIRSSEDSLESNYRYIWLLHDFPELYCKFKNEYYDGPVKTIRKIKENNDIYTRYEIAVKQKNIHVLKELYSEIIGEFI